MPTRSLSIVAISDTHGMHAAMEQAVPDGDVLIHAGDFCGRGRAGEVRDFAAWIGALPHRHKIVTPGNHDSPVENDAATFREVFAAQGIRLLINETVEIEGFRFFGSPYTPTFLNWHFMRDRGPAIRAEWETIPDDADVVVTHGPAYGHGDLAPPWRGEPPRHVGCLELLNRLRSVRPRLHVFGHIHDGYGVTISDEIPGTTFVNASVCTEAYRPSNRPHRCELIR
jgi:Icc-related predicted phosphoesterase